jgi:hypothetical protein
VVDAAHRRSSARPAEAVDAGVAAPPRACAVRDRDQDGTVDPFAHP